MAWITFNGAVSPEPLQQLDNQFLNVANGMDLPCTATGTNAISLSPQVSFPALTGYSDLGGFRFRAVNNSTGPVTAQFNGLGFLPVVKADGATPASTGDILAGQQYILTFSAALNAFFLEAPSVAVATGLTTTFVPGGRLTFQSATPVMFSSQTGVTSFFYAPYNHQFVPIYNGSTMQMYNFCSGLSDQVGLTVAMGGNAVYPANTNYDVFATLNGGVPVLATVQWTNQTTRALTLAVFGGLLTNSGVSTMRISQSSTISVPINQGTFLGTFATDASTGTTDFIFGGAASGGSAAKFLLCNYYNKILQNTIVTDNGAIYTYTSGTIRQARASAGNQVQLIQSDSERAIIARYEQQVNTVGATGAFGSIGIGVNSTTAFNAQNVSTNAGAGGVGFTYRLEPKYMFTTTGLVTISANEASDNSNANTFNTNTSGSLGVAVWL